MHQLGVRHEFTEEHTAVLARAGDWVTLGDLVGDQVTAVELDVVADLVRWQLLDMDDQRRYRRARR